MTVSSVALEIARILIEFEIEQQKRAAADGEVSEATPPAAAQATGPKKARQRASLHLTRQGRKIKPEAAHE